MTFSLNGFYVSLKNKSILMHYHNAFISQKKINNLPQMSLQSICFKTGGKRLSAIVNIHVYMQYTSDFNFVFIRRIDN